MSTPTTAQDLLNQILGAGTDLIEKAKSTNTSELTSKGKAMYKQAEDALADKLGVGDDAVRLEFRPEPIIQAEEHRVPNSSRLHRGVPVECKGRVP